MKARLGGAFLIDPTTHNIHKGDLALDARFKELYGRIGYVWIDLPDGTTLSLFYNDATRLFVADIIKADESGGNEFVRTRVPQP